MALSEGRGWQITCDGPECTEHTGIYERITSALFEATRGDWCRLGREWFCPACAWDVQVCLTEPVAAPEEEAVNVVRIAE